MSAENDVNNDSPQVGNPNKDFCSFVVIIIVLLNESILM